MNTPKVRELRKEVPSVRNAAVVEGDAVPVFPDEDFIGPARVMGNTVTIALSDIVQAGKTDRIVWIAFLGNGDLANEIAAIVNGVYE